MGSRKAIVVASTFHVTILSTNKYFELNTAFQQSINTASTKISVSIYQVVSLKPWKYGRSPYSF